MVKKQPQKNKYIAFIKRNAFTIFLYIIISPFVYTISGLHFIITTEGQFIEAQKHNPVKPFATIMPSFAERNNLKKIDEDNSPVFFTVSTPSYLYVYQGKQSIDELHQLLKPYLENQGYTIEDKLYTYDENCSAFITSDDCPDTMLKGYARNNGKPYWIMKGKKGPITVYAEISNYTYRNKDGGDDKKVNKNKKVIYIVFYNDK